MFILVRVQKRTIFILYLYKNKDLELIIISPASPPPPPKHSPRVARSFGAATRGRVSRPPHFRSDLSSPSDASPRSYYVGVAALLLGGARVAASGGGGRM